MWSKVLLFTTLVAAGSGVAVAAGSGNPTHDRLLRLPPAEQAKMLATELKAIGFAMPGIGI